MNTETKKLYRSRDERIIGGVCGGIADYFVIDPTLIRIIFLVLGFGMGSGFLIYLLLLLLVPLEPLAGHEPHASSVDHLAEQAKNAVEKMAGKAEEAFLHKEKKPPRDGARTIFGLIMVLVGIAVFVNIFAPIPHMAWRILWPLLLIVLGVAVITKE